MAEDPAARFAHLESALRQFIDTINATGGVIRGTYGVYVPAADPEWLDLGAAYVDACKVLGVDPKFIVVEEDI
jgi:hypothetical protein